MVSVIRLASYEDFLSEGSERCEEVTVRGTEWILRGARNLRVEQFLFASTMLVHAPAEPGGPKTE